MYFGSILLDMLALILALALQQDPAVGVRQMLVFSAPADTIRAVVWYPTNATPRDTTLGLIPVRIASDAPLAPSDDPYPLVLISHGSGGNEFGHLNLAMALARAGIVVMSIRHPGDNFMEGNGRGTDVEFYGRSHHIVRALDSLLALEIWRRHVDPDRIGFFGFSAGGYTGLTLLGARPDFGIAARFCEENPNVEPYCDPGISLTNRFQAPRIEPRIRAAALTAPGFSFLIDSVSLQRVRVPLLILRAELDEVVREPGNVTRLVRFVDTVEPVYVIPGAGHYVFLTPCGEALTAEAPEICVDEPGVNREAIHREINEKLVAFFHRYLAAR